MSVKELVTRGRFNFGRYDHPLDLVNPLDADVVPGVPVPAFAKHLRLKEWQAFQFGNGRYFINVALFNAKALALVQVKIYDRQERKKHLFEKPVPPWAFRLPTNLLDSETSYRSKDCSVSFRNLLAEGRIVISLDIAARPGVPRIVGSVTALTRDCEPMVVCIPFAQNRGMYSHKGLVPAVGRLFIDRTEVAFGEGDGYLLMDDHRGYYPYRMEWDWATAGTWRDGRLVGFNLTRNQSIDPVRYNENCFWSDGVAHALPPVEFVRHDDRQPEQWSIRDRNGQVDVTFNVEIDGRVDINALVFRSDYRGPFGTFEGTLRADDGASLDCGGMFGMGEDFDLRC